MRVRSLICSAMVVVLLAGAVPALALTRRHDRTDQQYIGYGGLEEFASVGKVLADTGGQWLSLGTGTLIAPDWVLTAGHAIAGSVTFTVGGGVYSADPTSYHKHPSADIGLFQLTTALSSVTPALRYSSDFGSEVGRAGMIVGYGNSGTGLTGEVEPAGTKRAGQNMIDWNGADWGWGSDLILVDFDSPGAAMDLECGPAHGDSGGGIFVDVGAQTLLAGVQTSIWFTDGTDNADYGDGGSFLRVATYNDWIDSIVPSVPTGPMSMEVVSVDNAAELTGYVTQDLVLSTPTDWLSAQLRVTLSEPGGVYQDAVGNTNPQSPNPAWLPLRPVLAFDTYVGNGVLGESVSTTGAVDLGGPLTAVFDEDGISIAWWTSDHDDIGLLDLARLTLANDATGTWSFLATAQPAEGPMVMLEGYVVNGELVFELTGDVNGDGFVGQVDLDIVLGEWGNRPPIDPRADPDGNGMVAQGDLDYVLANWGQGLAPAGGQSVPEPGTLAIFAFCGFVPIASGLRRKPKSR